MTGCTCGGCQSLCKRWPGFLTPRQVRQWAQRRGCAIPELFRTILCVDPWFADTHSLSAADWDAKARRCYGKSLYRAIKELTGGQIPVLRAAPATGNTPAGWVILRESFFSPQPIQWCGLQDRETLLCTVHDHKPLVCRLASMCHPLRHMPTWERVDRTWTRPAAMRLWQELYRSEALTLQESRLRADAEMAAW